MTPDRQREALSSFAWALSVKSHLASSCAKVAVEKEKLSVGFWNPSSIMRHVSL